MKKKGGRTGFDWKSWIPLALLVLLFIAIRTINFQYHFNFSSDQAEHATDILQYFRQHKIPLIGNPITSTQFEGRMMFQGPAYYYMYFIFLVLTGFAPIASSYLFMVFCALMTVPLYFGISWLVSKRAAVLISIIYTLAPYYIDYTRFHWNPTYQFALMPIVILIMGLYKRYHHPALIVALFTMLGILFQFHYTFALAVGTIYIYYLFITPRKLQTAALGIAGFLIGISPLILFELRNHFYNINTMILFIQNRDRVVHVGQMTMSYYYLSFSILALLALLALFKKLIDKIPVKIWMISLAALIIGLSAYDVYHYSKIPPYSFWAFSTNWNYPAEKKVYDIIRKENIKDFNIANLTYYNTQASVQKFLLKRDNIQINFNDYYGNPYLFVIHNSNDFNFMTPYEVYTFTPRKILKTWKINEKYNLYLLKRLPKSEET